MILPVYYLQLSSIHIPEYAGELNTSNIMIVSFCTNGVPL